MKKFFFFTVIAMLAFNSSFARIWRINNVAGVTADFTTVQLAHDDIKVQAGDTLHLEPSTVSYGNLVMSKRLTIISIGDFFGTDTTVQYSPLTGRLGNITISNVNANGSVLHCNSIGTVNLSGVNNIRIERCHIESTLTLSNSASTAILDNFLYDVIISTNSSGIVVSNNIFEYYIDMAITASASIANNVFKATGSGNYSVQIYNSTFQNNIINKAGLTITFFSSIVQNNISSNTTLPTGSGNINSAVMANVFVNPNGTDDLSFRLQTTVANPAAGATAALTDDLGAFGGTSPFKPGLQPAIPAIYKLSGPVTPSGNTMNVTFSTRSNN